MSNTDSIFTISLENKKKIDTCLQQYPKDRARSAVVSALLFVQEQNKGWLSEPAMLAVSEYLQLPYIQIYEVATFYDMYELVPIAKHKIGVCVNLTCMLRGADKIIQHLEEKAGAKMGENCPNGDFTLRAIACQAECGRAPILKINDDKAYGNLDCEKIDHILSELSKKGQ